MIQDIKEINMETMTKEIKTVVARIIYALRLQPEDVDFEALYEIIKYLPDDELQVLLSCFGFSTTPMSIEETAKALGIASLEVIDSLSNAFERIESQKSTFYSGKEISEEPEVDIRAIDDLNTRVYNCLKKAGKKHISDLKLEEISDIQGLSPRDCTSISNLLTRYKSEEAIIKSTLQDLKELRDK